MIYFRAQAGLPRLPAEAQCCPNGSLRAKSRALFMKLPATRPVRSQRPRPTPSPCRERKKVEMLLRSSEAHPQARSIACLRGPNGAKDEFLLAATAQNLRKLAKLIPFPEPAFAL